MKQIKRLLSMFLALVLVLGMIPATAQIAKAADQIPALYVADAQMFAGQYLKVGSKTPTTVKPTSGGYVYYDGTQIVLHDFRYEGPGFNWYSNNYAVFYIVRGDISVVLEGENKLVNTAEGAEVSAIKNLEGSFTFSGDGSLQTKGVIATKNDIKIMSGNYDLSGDENAIVSEKGNVSVFGGKIEAKTAGEYAIHPAPTFDSSVVASASAAVNGSFVEYNIDSYKTYKHYKIAPKVWVGGVQMPMDTYLRKGAAAPSAIRPVGVGYAYYDGTTVTLHDYEYSGWGKVDADLNACVYGIYGLKIKLEGVNRLSQTASNASAVMTQGNVEITGDGTLTAIGDYGIRAADVVIDNGILNILAVKYGILSDSIAINGGYVDARSSDTANDSSYWAISSTPVVNSNLPILASTSTSGALGNYGASNIANYDRIVIGYGENEVYIGDVRMLSGNYLASGATTVTDTVPESGGYAYYVGGILLLKDFQYEGNGYRYKGSDFAAIYTGADLVIIVAGDNSIVATESDFGYAPTGIYVDGASLQVTGVGTLSVEGNGSGIYADKGVSFYDGTIDIAGGWGIVCQQGAVKIEDGYVSIEAVNTGIGAAGVQFNGGVVDIKTTGSGNAPVINSIPQIAPGLSARAAMEAEGDLGEYNKNQTTRYHRLMVAGIIRENSHWGQTESDIIKSIVYTPNDDGTFNASINVDLTKVSYGLLDQLWAATGFCWYDHDDVFHQSRFDSADMDTLVFTMKDVVTGLVPGKHWDVKVYLSDEYYADEEMTHLTCEWLYSLEVPEHPYAEVLEGWQLIEGGWYFYENGKMVTDAWRKDSTGWCYLGADGEMLTNQWVKDSTGWCYIDGSGYIVYNKWVKDSTGWCYVDGSGYMVYNKWVKDSTGWCYVDGSGYMVYNKWVKDSTGWCYVDGSGYMVYNEWVKDGGSWYYIDANGYMLANTSKNIGGKTYKFNASGVCTNP